MVDFEYEMTPSTKYLISQKVFPLVIRFGSKMNFYLLRLFKTT